MVGGGDLYRSVYREFVEVELSMFGSSSKEGDSGEETKDGVLVVGAIVGLRREKERTM